MDIGTSGLRLQLLDVKKKSIIKTVMSSRHPLPGGNIIDHLDFSIKIGEHIANQIIINAIIKLIKRFNVPFEEIEQIAVCGNPIQLSLFQNIEIRDLAYAGKNMQKRLGIEVVDRDLKIYNGDHIFGENVGFHKCQIIVLPSIQHEIGADALAMMIKTGFLDQCEVSIVTDYGTNAEMALKVGNRIITCSASAGPAIEGQGIKDGMLAAPGAISDINEENGLWRLTILDENMQPVKGDLIDPVTGIIYENTNVKPIGITGTGVISAIAVALKSRMITHLPHLPNGKLILSENVNLHDEDISEAGKAIGAIRAAHLTLLVEAGLYYEDLVNMYMSGASGAYVNAEKAQSIGLSPIFSKRIIQFGNTSLALARDVAFKNIELDTIIRLAAQIKTDHIMLASNQTFINFYTCELAYWTEGMSYEMYNNFLDAYNLPKVLIKASKPIIDKIESKDIMDVGYQGIEIITDSDILMEEKVIGCIGCNKCELECPEKAIKTTIRKGNVYATYKANLCMGMSCKRCVKVCPVKVLHYNKLKIISV